MKNKFFANRCILSAFATALFFAVQSNTSSQAATLPDQTLPQPFGVQLKAPNNSVENLDKIQALGLKMVRRGFGWEAIEKEKGVYDFSLYDRLVKDCKDRGLTIVACMAFSNQLYGHAKDEPGRSAYAKYAAALAAHYKGENLLFEIWNEPNVRTFWGKHGTHNSEQYAEEYTNLVKAVVPAMKAADPNCFVMAGSVSGLWSASFEWMDFCFQKGILKTGVDAWSVHPYSVKNPEDYVDAYAKMRASMAKNGGPATIPVLNTERGFPLGKAEGFAGGDAALAKDYQAWHLVRQYLIDQLCEVKATIWYEWSGSGAEGFDLYDPNEETKAMVACRVLIQQFNGYKFEKRLDLGAPRDFALQFKNAKGDVKIVAWTGPPREESPDMIKNHTAKIPVTAKGSFEVVRVYGAPGAVTPQNGAAEVMLTGSPLYLNVGTPRAAVVGAPIPGSENISAASKPATAPPISAPAASSNAATKSIRLDALVDGQTDWKAGIDRDATATVEVVQDQTAPGHTALRFAAEIKGPKGSARLKKSLKGLNLADDAVLRMKIKGETATVFGLVLIDSTGQTHQKKGNSIKIDEWTEFTIDPQKIAGGEHWGGANDGKWHGPLDSITFTYNIGSDKESQKPSMLIADITAETGQAGGAGSTTSSVENKPTLSKPAAPKVAAAEGKPGATIRLDELVNGQTDWKAGIDRDATATVEVVKDQPEAGQNALRFAAEIKGPKGSARLRKSLKGLNLSDGTLLRMKIKGETATVFGLVLVDGTGQVHQKKGNRLKTDGEWTEFTIDPQKIAGGEHWGGANDGKWHGPLDSITFTYNIGSDKESQKPSMLISDITAETGQTSATASASPVAAKSPTVSKPIEPKPAAPAAPMLAAAGDNAATTTIRLDELVDGKTDWKAGIDRDATASVEVVKDQPAAGQNALRFAAEIKGPKGSARLRKSLKGLNLADVKVIRMKIKGETATVFGLVLVDGTGQVHQKKGNRLKTDGEWTEFTIDPQKIAGGEHWGGANDGKWHGPLDSITFTYNIGSDKESQKPVMIIGDITADVVKGGTT
jgi:hypothetical protein